jgi:hypothetical protein
MPRSTPACCIAALLFMAGAAASAAETPEVPRHLALARELVQNIEPGDNQYILGGETITFPGDAGSSRYAMKADCSGFALALFARSGYSIRRQMQFLVDTPRRRRPRAEDFVLSIEEERGFKRIFHVADVRPGDIYAHAILSKEDQAETGTTGHVMIVDTAPRKIAPQPPLVPGTEQYALDVIDSNEEMLGSDDTRVAHGSKPGLGRGTIRMYADAGGSLVGWARTFRKAIFYSYDPRFKSDSLKARKAAVGRPVT